MNSPDFSAAYACDKENPPVAPISIVSDACWHAVYTSGRHEKSVAAKLQNRQVCCFLPLFETEHRWGGRRVTVQLPLFANYLFVRISTRERVRVLETPGVIQIVGTKTAPAEVPAKEIESLRQALAEGLRISPHGELSVGQRVRIERGPFCGREGILVRSNQNMRVVVSVEAIRQSFSVEVGFADVRVAVNKKV